MSKTITDLREKMFDTIDALNRKEDPMEVERALAIVKVAGSIIDSAKVEVEAMRISGARGTGFVAPIETLPAPADSKPAATKPLLGHERLSSIGKR